MGQWVRLAGALAISGNLPAEQPGFNRVLAIATTRRRVRGKGDDSVVKLRPVDPEELAPELRVSPNFGVEVDAMPGGYVYSGSMKHTLDPDEHQGRGGGEDPRS